LDPGTSIAFFDSEEFEPVFLAEIEENESGMFIT
jgi:hypothetical protein